MYKIKVMDFLTLFAVLLVTIVLSIIAIRHWILIFFIWQAIQIVVGIVTTSWITAFILTFFNAFTTEKWEGFNTRWLYSGIFFTAVTVVYFCVVYSLIDYAVNFAKNLFRSR